MKKWLLYKRLGDPLRGVCVHRAIMLRLNCKVASMSRANSPPVITNLSTARCGKECSPTTATMRRQ